MDLIFVTVWTAIAFVLAFFSETMVEYFIGTPMDKIEKLRPYKWVLSYISAAVGVFFALYFKLDLLAMMGFSLAAVLGSAESVISITTVGMVATGLAVGRGAEFLHKFVMKFFENPKLPTGAG